LFSEKFDKILLSLAPVAELKLFPPYARRRTWASVEPRRAAVFEARAQRAMAEGVPALYLSDAADLSGGGKARFSANQRARREVLKAIALDALVRGGDAQRFARMADLIYALCEEAFWGPPEAYAGMTEGRAINDVSLETADLLAACTYLFKDVGLPAFARALSFAALAVNARVLKPLLKRDDFFAPLAGRFELPRAAERALTAALVLCADDHERWLCVRKLLSLLDQYIAAAPAGGGGSENLEAHVRAASAYSACVDLVMRAVNHELEFRADAAFRALVHLPCELHVAGKWFINGGGSMTPNLSPDELYEMASFSGDRALSGLSASLHRLSRDSALGAFDEDTGPLLRQAHRALMLEELLRESAREPRYEDVALPSLPLYARRAGGFYAALTGGAHGAHPSVGNFILFWNGEPVFFDADGPSATRDHTLPTVEGAGQVPGEAARDASADENGMYFMISMNIASAYAKEADLLSWQRTILFMPVGADIRLMEVYDFDAAAHAVAFHFVTPHQPIIGPGGVRVGPVTLTWENDLEARAERLQADAPAYRLTLLKRAGERSGSETFIITANEVREGSF
jgi:hypothetical protein